MTPLSLNILVFAVALLSLWRGWRMGVARELALLIGWAFAVIMTRIFLVPVTDFIADTMHSPPTPEALMRDTWLAVTAIFGIVIALCSLATSPLSSILRFVPRGPLGRFAGSILAALQWLSMLSVILNLWGAVDNDCMAVNVADGGDGGVVEEVMLIAPAITGAPDFSEMVHLRQLRNAKAISKNSSTPSNVVFV